MNKLKTYKLSIDDLDEYSGVNIISLVNQPAIEVDWVAFSKHEKVKQLFSIDEEKQMITGPFMIPDLLIYRRDESGNEFNVTIDKETIEKVSNKFFKNKNTTNINLEHSADVDNATVVESWLIKDPEMDKSKLFGFTDLPVGTWMGTVHLSDTKFWNEFVKTGKVKGFSIEGFMNMNYSTIKKEIENMSKVKFTEIPLKNGSIFLDGEAAVGTYVYQSQPSVALVNGVKSTIQNQMWDGEYEINDGNILTVLDGQIQEIKQKIKNNKQEKEMKFSDYKTKDGATIQIDGDKPVADAAVTVTDDKGVVTPAPDADYTLEDGTVVTVVGGKITDVKAVEAPVANADAPVATPDAPAADNSAVLDEVKKLLEADKAEDQKVFDTLNTRIAALEEALSTATTTNADMAKQLEKFNKMVGGKEKTSITEKDVKMNNKEKLTSNIDKINFIKTLKK